MNLRDWLANKRIKRMLTKSSGVEILFKVMDEYREKTGCDLRELTNNQYMDLVIDANRVHACILTGGNLEKSKAFDKLNKFSEGVNPYGS